MSAGSAATLPAPAGGKTTSAEKNRAHARTPLTATAATPATVIVIETGAAAIRRNLNPPRRAAPVTTISIETDSRLPQVPASAPLSLQTPRHPGPNHSQPTRVATAAAAMPTSAVPK